MPQPESETSPDREQSARLKWITHVRRLHRTKRLAGFAGIVLGASMLMWWKLDPTAPDWGLWVGIGVLGISWALFIYVIAARWMWVKNNPYKPST